ncbi:MAG TPA: methyltransferase domain-containing protein [Caulobacteraceae bacterium]|jgi:ubiquinone/menaquinone biosynthesis C-methylase UbiE
MQQYDWWYDDRRQVGLDFEDEQQVATYDARQGGSADWDRSLLQGLGLGSEMRMADIGCGTGILVCEAAKICREATGIDVSKAMLRTAAARASGLGLSNLTFQNAGFLTFEAAEGGFDLVTSKAALHHLPDFWKALAIARIREALRPGGLFYLRDVMFCEPPQHLASAAETWISNLVARSGYAREDGVSHIRDEHTTFTWVIQRMLVEAGFQVRRHTHEGNSTGVFVAERVG